MNRLQFIIVTSLSGTLAFCILLHIVLVWMTQAEDAKLKDTDNKLQQGQMCYTRLQQIARRVAILAQAQQDQQLRDLLTRQNIQVTPPPNASGGGTAPSPSTTAAPAPNR